MRNLSIVILLAAVTGLSGCTSSGIESIVPKRAETTGSIAAPTPGRAVGEVAGSAEAEAQPYPDDESAFVAVSTHDEQAASPPAAKEEHAGDIVARLAMARPGKVGAGRAGAQKVYDARFGDAHPISFGKAEPSHYPVHGVDVSRWQGDIDWKTLRRQGANFAYIKATEGGDHVDPTFQENWRKADEAGIVRGAYHFFYWCTPALDQAKWFIRNVPKEKGALPPVIDVEWNSHSRSCRTRPPKHIVLKKMQVFMDTLEAHYGQQPVIYVTPDFYEDNLKGQFTGHSFWLRAVAEHPSKVYPGRDFAFWQYSGTGLASGVDNHIDLNVFNGSQAGWNSWVKKRTR